MSVFLKLVKSVGHSSTNVQDKDEFRKINIERFLEQNQHIKFDSEQEKNDFFKNNIKIANFSILSIDRKEIGDQFHVVSLEDLVNFFNNIDNLIDKNKCCQVEINYKLVEV